MFHALVVDKERTLIIIYNFILMVLKLDCNDILIKVIEEKSL